jgi:hypothetical protein
MIKKIRVRTGIKVEGKVVPMHAMKAYRGSEVTVPLILNISHRCR